VVRPLKSGTEWRSHTITAQNLASMPFVASRAIGAQKTVGPLLSRRREDRRKRPMNYTIEEEKQSPGRLQVLAKNIWQLEARLKELEKTLKTAKNKKAIFSLEESIRTNTLIKQGLLTAFWED
jgi:hypothetical protein